MPPHTKNFNAIDGFPVLDRRKNLFILTGAGISAESGLRTFRDGDGLWENHRIEDVATPEAFARNPVLVQRFYNARRAQLREVEPNAAHRALAELEKLWEGEFTLVTQNVDDLHERGGSKNPIHMHGELRKARCLHSDEIFPWDEDINDTLACACCDTAGTLRPHIVWFGEMPLFMEDIYAALRRCDIFIAIGTSGQVYPAAGFSMEARRSGAWTIECNLVSSDSPVFETVLEDKATLTLPRIVELCA
ncbi:MAG: NAD-dependent deacylase [Alphaproteobacteria bacterium]|nr:NAD-dependent deacylase [Alphaproteobacteria bacterium]